MLTWMLYMFVCCPAAVSLPLPLVSPLLCCFVTMAVNVTGAVQLTGGAAFLHLQPAELQPQAGFVYKALRTTEEIATRIRRGEVVVHPTREPFTKEALNLTRPWLQLRTPKTEEDEDASSLASSSWSSSGSSSSTHKSQFRREMERFVQDIHPLKTDPQV